MRGILTKKSQFESTLIVVITIVIIGIVFFFSNHVVNKLYTGFSNSLGNSSTMSDSTAIPTIEKIRTAENSAWDYGFLAIFIGLLMQIVLFSFATRINIAFFWIMVIVDLPILFVGVILSNIWQEMVSNPQFSDTILRFPITNSILGTYYPVVLVAIFFIGSIILFGKPPGSQQ